MLITADLNTLVFSQLKKVYAEGIQENGEYFYPDSSEQERLELSARDFWEYLSKDYFQTSENLYWVWTESGEYISALRLETYEDGFLLEALETKPEERQKGYAKRLMEAVLKHLPSETKVYSHVSKKNIASLNTHRSCGFTQIMDYAVDLDGTIAENQVTLCITT